MTVDADEAAARAAREQAKVDSVFRRASRAWRPPPRLNLSQWADEFFVIPAGTAAEPGRWRTIPYQRGIMDAITDPSVTQVSLMKSSRVGYTLMVNATVGYYVHQDPASILVVQPTVDGAQGYSKDSLAPMFREVPVLADLIAEPRAKNSSNTILHKVFPGGQIKVVGANSPAGFRRVSMRVVLFDEVDAYPPSAGSEGDPIKLGMKRAEYFWNRKIVCGSTPVLAGASRIEELFEAGDQRRYYVPCPHCGHMDILVFRREAERGHYMAWPDGQPEDAHFVCRRGGCVIEHRSKREMVAAGEWRPEAPFRGHASFHVWAAYSFSPNATWGQIAQEFVEANAEGAEQLRVFVNTTLGEPWREKGEAPDWQRLLHQREPFDPTRPPAEVLAITAGVDVQKDRLYYEVVGWSEDKQSWSLEAGVFMGDTSDEEAGAWLELDELLERTWLREDGAALQIRVLAVDSGYNTNTVYSWGRRYPRNRVIATKGVARKPAIIDHPTKVDVTVRGKRAARGYLVWPIGVDMAKAELYGWLKRDPPAPDAPFPRGWCHFSQQSGEPYFKQLTAEHLVSNVNKRTGRSVYEWQVQGGRENHWLDCRVGARAAASLAGLDQLRRSRRPPPRPASASAPAVAAPATPPTPQPQTPPVSPASAPNSPRPRPKGGWLGGGGGGGGRLGGGPRGGNWLGRRRR